ncbi:MAG: AAA family ATPase, partial [Clostridiales bacterium]|nr:AAA family ATPase [Clostridiales bacterium]
GIGKTAIVEQVAGELGIGFVSYSMTHHTRQSALGLPFIREREYGGKNVRVTEYTMSEIIASIYEQIEVSGISEGILFLDEINCVSETLTPAMLQFLQYKVFGQHRVPEGWTVVTAGNPPEYNQAVREFDMVTWDRVKRIDIEPDHDVWHEWAINNNVHRSILSYLDLRPEDLYKVEMTADGRKFVTPRGWTDLGDMITVLEENGDPVDADLTSQYLQDNVISRRFASYYSLWKERQREYDVSRILDGDYDREMISRASDGDLEERITLTNILIAGIINELRSVLEERASVKSILAIAKAGTGASREDYEVKKVGYDSHRRNVSAKIENLFGFMEEAFGDDREMLLLITELTADHTAASYLGIYGSEGYNKHSRSLRFYEREQQLIREIDESNVE